MGSNQDGTLGGPSSASLMDPEPEQIAVTSANRPRPVQSLVAAAQRLTSKEMDSRSGWGAPQAWQEDAWEMYNLVGEQRFLTTTLANRVGQVRFYAGRRPVNEHEEPVPCSATELPTRVFKHFGGTEAQRAQIITRLAANLFVPGDGWLAGVPRDMMPGQSSPTGERTPLADVAIEDLEWRMLSINEVSHGQGKVTLKFGAATSEQVVCKPEEVFLIRVWRPHPRQSWEADSPTRSSLPVLRELVGLTMHISAQVDSRLAGAGLLIVPQSAKRALQQAAGIPEDSDEDPFTDALIEAMLTPIQDRASASAVVPLVVTVPDDAADKFQLITFDKPLDNEARGLREEAIRRVALGEDAPPELLLGTAGMNHWGAWLVREDVVTTHIEPPAALIADAITTQYLWPVLEQAGMSETEAREYVIWYEVGHMVQRPNRLADALTLHDKGAIGDETLREAGGFSDEDAPPEINRAVELAIEVATANPNLIDNLAEVVKAFDTLLNPRQAEAAAAQADTLESGDNLADEEATDEQRPDSAEEQVTGRVSRPQEQPGPVARGTDTDRADESQRTSRDPGGPPSRPPTFASPAVTTTVPSTVVTNPAATKITAARGWAPMPPVVETITAAAPGADIDESVTIVALPAEGVDLPGSEQKHATLVYCGKVGDDEDALALRAALERSVETLARRTEVFSSVVAGVGALGDEGATVMFLDPAELSRLRETLLADETVGKLLDMGIEKGMTLYPNYRAHVTLGYDDVTDEDKSKADEHQFLAFDRLAVWWGEEQIAFDLGTGPKHSPEEMDEAAVKAAQTPGTLPADHLEGSTV